MLPVDEQWIKSEFVRTESERADGVDGWPIKERTAGSVTKFDSSTARGSISWKRCSWGLNGSVAGGAFREPAVGAFRSAGDPLIFETPITDLNTTERLGHLQNRRAQGLSNLGGTVLLLHDEKINFVIRAIVREHCATQVRQYLGPPILQMTL